MIEFTYEVINRIEKKKKKLGGVAMVGIASALLAAACKGTQDTPFNPAKNKNDDVYGPPIMAADDYEPSDNYNNDVYGPPEDMLGESDDGFSFKEDTSSDFNPRDISGNLRKEDISSDDYDPRANIAEPVYGPPAGEPEEATE